MRDQNKGKRRNSYWFSLCFWQHLWKYKCLLKDLDWDLTDIIFSTERLDICESGEFYRITTHLTIFTTQP